MAAATQLAMSASSFFCPATIASKQVGPTSPSQSPATLVVCHHDSNTINISRRFFAVAAASATALVRPDGAQAKRSKAEEKKKKEEEPENKDLSAYDARVLANARRKEAMKASVEAAKLKAKSIASSATASAVAE